MYSIGFIFKLNSNFNYYSNVIIELKFLTINLFSYYKSLSLQINFKYFSKKIINYSTFTSYQYLFIKIFPLYFIPIFILINF